MTEQPEVPRDPAPAGSAETPASPVEAVDRALLVLQALSSSGGHGSSLADLAAGLGLNKSTVHRTLAALRFRDFAAQDPSTGTYLLGPAATRLAEDFLGDENLAVLLHPALVAMCAAADELVHLGVLSGTQVLYLDKVEPERSVRVWSAVGRRIPAVTTALGRALLAYRGTDRAALEAYVGAASALGGPTDAPRPRVDAEHVWAVIERARVIGYATEDEENEPGISCLAVPLLRSGTAVAAVSVTAPAERMSAERVARLHAQLRAVLPPLLPGGLTLPAL